MQFCPQCHLILESATWHDASLYACRNCGGVWFAASDFAALYPKERSAFGELNLLYPGLLDTSSASAYAGLPKSCPGCRTVLMEPVPLPMDPDITPAVCTRCGAHWLEPAERRRIAGHSDTPSVVSPTEQVPLPPEPAVTTPTELEAEVVSAAPVDIEQETIKPPDPFVLNWVPLEEAVTPTYMGTTVEVTDGSRETPDVISEENPPRTEPTPEEDVEEVLEELAGTDQDTCCPICLTVYAREEAVCRTCRCDLVDPEFRVWCPQCRVENSFAAERCRGCRKPLRTPEMLAQLYRHEPARESANEALGLAAGIPLAPPVMIPNNMEVRWCPQCRKRYPANLSFCDDCGVGLVVGNFRIRCLHCENANTIAADNCWSCQQPLHPNQPHTPSGLRPLSTPTATPPSLPPPNASLRPRPSGSCATLFIAGLLIVVPLVLSLLSSF